ncbi:hypothetical protein SISSUDRAFT_365194 [Sistotremastrum suecicum HHB10207 ss-3]|uniref:Uncharacterized protein n=1 Tax=Sistotremastrum suecicum HHB10207 ss-3 TaxID=1314776 RepID=A0A165Z3N8_9AGAM|nr:hypothetical protein SISSUDRAFT_365194 [Sistotremastrum suecicum HHB10207 ss-3]
MGRLFSPTQSSFTNDVSSFRDDPQIKSFSRTPCQHRSFSSSQSPQSRIRKPLLRPQQHLYPLFRCSPPTSTFEMTDSNTRFLFIKTSRRAGRSESGIPNIDVMQRGRSRLRPANSPISSCFLTSGSPTANLDVVSDA